MPWPLLPKPIATPTRADDRLYWSRELPAGFVAIAALAGAASVGWFALRPALPVAAILLQLAARLPALRRRWPRLHPPLDCAFGLVVGLAPAASTGTTDSLLWLAYFVVAQIAALRWGPTLLGPALTAALPFAAGLCWSATGLAPLAPSAAGLALIGMAATVTHVFLAGVGKLSTDFEAGAREQGRRAAAELERRRIFSQLHATLGAALAEVSALQDGADPRAAAQLAYPRARAALNELRAAVNGLDGREVDGARLEELLRRRLLARCDPAGIDLKLDVSTPGPVPASEAYHLLKLLDAAAQGAASCEPATLCVAVAWGPAATVTLEHDGRAEEPSRSTIAGLASHAAGFNADVEVAGTRVIVRRAAAAHSRPEGAQPRRAA